VGIKQDFQIQAWDLILTLRNKDLDGKKAFFQNKKEGF